MPFQILSGDTEKRPFILGFSEDLIVNLSKFIGLSVISQYSTQHIYDIKNDKEIKELGADYLVTGSFRLFKDNIRINIHLIRTSDNKVIFSKQYNEILDDAMRMLDDITQQVVNVLRQHIDYDILSYSYKKANVQLAAYENWLLGMDQLRKGTVENDLEAREYFEAALVIDPSFARAYSGISLSYFNEWSCQLWDRWDVSKKGAHKYALKALELDENDYVSLAVLGRTYLYSEDYEKAAY